MSDVEHLLPPAEPCSGFSLSAGDLLIAAAGFEDRATALVEMLTARPTSYATVIEYKPFDRHNRLRELLRTFRLKRITSKVLEYDRFAPYSFPSLLMEMVRDLSVRHVVLDISAMSKLAIMLCLEVCRAANLPVTVFYAEAQEYGPGREEYERARKENNLHRPSIQVYTGVRGVLHLGELASVSMQGQPTAAIAFMSFNECLTQAIVDALYPSRLFLINGRPPRLHWREEATAWIHEQLRREWPEVDNPLEKDGPRERLPKRSTSTLHYHETIEVLLELYWQLALDHRVLLAPTGSKMQTIACFLVKAMHKDIHVEYPIPTGFLDLYSTGTGLKWTVAFPRLGNFCRTLELKDRRENLMIPGPSNYGA